MENNKEQVFAYSLYIKGIWGRNRSVKFKGFPIVQDVKEKLTLEQLRPVIDERLAKLKPKSPFYYKVTERPETLEKMDGIIIRTCRIMLGGGDHILEQKTL